MFRLKNLLMLTVTATTFAFTDVAQAQVLCLQYPIFYDGTTNYLFVGDEYPSDPGACGSFEGECYIWVTTANLPTRCPQACGLGDCNTPIGVEELLKDAKQSEKADAVRPRAAAYNDNPLPAPPADSTFQFGKDYNGKAIPAVSAISNPSAGVFALTGDLIWVQAKTKVIPIRLYKVVLDYEEAGIATSLQAKSGSKRKLFVGLQVTTTQTQGGAPTISPALKTGVTYSGVVHYPIPYEKNGTRAYHIVTTDALQ